MGYILVEPIMSEMIKVLINGVIRGLASPANTHTVNIYRGPARSDLAAMRNDWRRVGATIDSAMTNAKAHGKTSNRSTR